MIAAIYLLKVIMCSGIMFLYYWLMLRNKAFHQWNRFYLLAIIVLSLLLPLLKIPVDYDNGNEVVRYISVASIDESIVIAAKPKPLFSLSVEQWLFCIYMLVAAILMVTIIKAAKEISDVLKSYPKQKLAQIHFLNTDAKGAPFSFLNYMVWNRDIDLQSETGKQIFRHELAHIEQKHTLDKIFLLLVLVPFWINPFFWLIRKELNAIHEFIADETALQNGSADDLSRMILNALYPKHAYLLTSPFFQTSIKRRLQMFAIKNQKINYMSRILVLPILFIVAAAFTIKQEGQKEKETFSGQSPTNIFNDTVPGKSKVIVEEISKNAKNVIVEDIPKVGKGIIVDIRNKIYLEADEIINHAPQDTSYTGPQQALLIVNGQKMDNSIWLDKTIVSKKLTVFPKNDKEAIKLYGSDAARGTIVFEDAKIINKSESKIYQEAQRDTVPNKDAKYEQPVFTKVQVAPVFDGDWDKFLQKNLNPEVPVNNGAPSGQYTVIAQFIVEMDGSITDLKTLTKHGYGMEDEVVKLLRQSPKWVPATQNGRKVRAYKKQPITFVISEDDEQTSNTTIQTTKQFDSPVITKVDEEAKYKGNWAVFLQQNLEAAVPAKNNAPAGTYTVIVEFVVDVDGKVYNPRAVTNKGFGMEEEVIRVMKLSSEWEPAKLNGKSVRAYRKQPIIFVVSAK